MSKAVRIFSIALCFLLLLSAPMQAYAADHDIVLRIISEEGFLNFAKNCRIDSYSADLTVILCADLDLTGYDFTPIPSFSGTLEGNGHTISGLDIQATGSSMGLFRYLTATAVVKDLHLKGSVAPGGSASIAGALAGQNFGTIQNCSFDGKVFGSETIGGLIGINHISGVIENASVSGTVYGNHFVGGIAGNNFGVIRSCENHGAVNTTVEENRITIEDITVDSITNSESAATVTDIGGICGTGTGVVEKCVNYGSIGYPQIGYNIGGIAGSFSGYLDSCINRGSIDGRKEVGGIVGQLEPAVSMIYEEDTLQTLQQQMDELSNATGGIGGNIQSGSNALTAQSQQVEAQLKDAQDALKILIPEDEENPTVPDEATIQAAKNALSSSISDLTGSFSTMAQISQNTFGSVVGSLQGISGQMDAIGNTISSASENMGGGIRDVSDDDTDQDQSAKIRGCFNLGVVQGDWNIGGIAGAIGLENDLDPDSDLQLIGNSSLNFDMELRAVILDCENRGDVHGKKQNVGGIAGWVSMGLVRQCVNTAAVDAAAADYTGGIAGQSSGFLRGCSVKCAITGDAYVGGIAGSGTTVSDCNSIVRIHGATEKYGAILGFMEEATLTSNYYLLMDSDPGAVDGISYQAQAQPLSAEQFFALKSLPDSFHFVTVTFVYDDTNTRRVTLPYGSILSEDLIPDLPQEHDRDTVWSGPIQPGEVVLQDMTFLLESTFHIATLESSLRSDKGLPILLVQGQFQRDAQLAAEALDVPGSVAAWAVTLPKSETAMKLRCYIGTDWDPSQLKLRLRSGGDWQDATFTVDGSYIVFSVTDETDGLQLVAVPKNYAAYYIAGAAFLAVILVVIIALRKRKKKST